MKFLIGEFKIDELYNNFSIMSEKPVSLNEITMNIAKECELFSELVNKRREGIQQKVENYLVNKENKLFPAMGIVEMKKSLEKPKITILQASKENSTGKCDFYRIYESHPGIDFVDFYKFLEKKYN